MLQAELRVVGGKQQGKLIPLNVKKFLIGRGEDCQLRPNSDLVSRHHCVFTNDDYTIRLRDLGSTNGTYLNGERLQGQSTLKNGDQVQIGKLSFQMVIREVAATRQGVAAPAGQADEAEAADLQAEQRAADASALDDLSGLEDANSVPSDSDSAVLDIQSQPPTDSDTHLVGAQHAGTYEGGDTTVIVPPQGPEAPIQQVPLVPQGGPQPQFSAAQLLAAMQQLAASQLSESDTAVAPPAQQPAPKTPKVVLSPVNLPPPEETGAPEPKPPEAAKPAAAAGEAPKNPSNAAADIIRMHSQRRPK